MTFDSRQSLMRIIISLFDKTQLLSLTLVQSALDTVSLLQSLQGKDEKFCVVLVGKRREGNGSKPSALQPMNGCCVNCNCLLGTNVRSILKIYFMSKIY